eukprot:30935-Pelagococcus_subviridis.AAC.18
MHCDRSVERVDSRGDSLSLSLLRVQTLRVRVELAFVVLERHAQIRDVDRLLVAHLNRLVLVRPDLNLPQHLRREVLAVPGFRRLPALRHPFLPIAERVLVPGDVEVVVQVREVDAVALSFRDRLLDALLERRGGRERDPRGAGGDGEERDGARRAVCDLPELVHPGDARDERDAALGGDVLLAERRRQRGGRRARGG